MKHVTLRLSKENDPTDYFDLKYKIIDNDFTRKWINCVLEAHRFTQDLRHIQHTTPSVADTTM